ncbi:MAG: hypothetical protein PWQ59_1931 [Thermoanaerobacterium sp.]|jgi:hypothetical protein|nr:hypothetical protein [Thermoanaerobacterium sp.]MDK2823552.1 hypothetical protein [Clostridia bacterium]
MFTYSLPNFGVYKPQKLRQLAAKIVVDKDIDNNFSGERIELAIKKLKNSERLLSRDYKILCFYLNRVIEDNLLEKFTERITKYFNEKEKIYPYLKALLRSYYDLSQNNDVIFRVLKLGFLKDINLKENILASKDLFISCNNTLEVLQKINNGLIHVFDLESQNKIIESYLIKPTDLFAKKLFYIKSFGMVKENLYINNCKYFLEHINKLLDLNARKKIYETFLIKEKGAKDYSNLVAAKDNIFRNINNELGDPYDKYNAKWQNISEEAIDVFRQWLTQKNLREFFTTIAGDSRRLDFWLKYKKYFYRVEHFSELDDALLMETSRHIFIEFAYSGALYMYDRDYLDLGKLKNMIKTKSRSHIISFVLKNRAECLERLIHQGDWEYRFNYEFKSYGYHPER